MGGDVEVIHKRSRYILYGYQDVFGLLVPSRRQVWNKLLQG